MSAIFHALEHRELSCRLSKGLFVDPSVIWCCKLWSTENASEDNALRSFLEAGPMNRLVYLCPRETSLMQG
jgi:hypothetical protein